MKTRLAFRLLFSLIVISTLAHAIVWVFAPRWLLLDQANVSATWPLALEVASMCTAGVAAYIVIRVGRLRMEGEDLEPVDLLDLFALPARIAVTHVALTTVLSIATLFPRVAPAVERHRHSRRIRHSHAHRRQHVGGSDSLRSSVGWVRERMRLRRTSVHAALEMISAASGAKPRSAGSARHLEQRPLHSSRALR